MRPDEPRTAAGSAPVRARGRRRLTVRVRILASVIVLAALTVLIAGATAFWLQSRETDARIDNSLTRAVAALRKVESEPDPRTEQQFTDVDGLLNAAVRNRVPGKNEGVITLQGDRLSWTAAKETHALRLDADEELVAHLARLSLTTTTTHVETFRTDVTEYRLMAAPVGIQHDPTLGLFVVAFDRSAEMRALQTTFWTYSAVGILALGAISIAAWFVVGRMLHPVRLLRDTARRVTESDLSERITVSSNDDLGDLAHTVNAMLDRLERAFGSQRELLDDVGHELRTPLTIVRGHLELLDPDDPDDVRATQALALDELDRMHRLVDDLMILATAERPDFVRLAPTDVGRLTDDVHDKARGLGERRLLVSSRADVTVRLDAQRITQAWLQLLANAYRFSPPSSTVWLGSEVVGDRLLLWVRDEGPGVPPEEEKRIFERFHRGRADRSSHGAGLGLPIVAAIAQAHHGQARVERPPGGQRCGVVFVLDLPAVDLVDGATTAPIPLPDLAEHR
ncbi:sensor histidine kinase [Cellulomonas fimi]|uniref:histidine kinase n=1 Tax=Cellulomonas fimi (strain ATCC 484 / DSM 20113 / JCM 1341 / CCUG 24087 / LMG 16345 / NBRC 15513 / NCIMB 8980 / NCTC 7547 / NRS-133) TaxID=590998 RepID=F4H1E6_CELFA|nr:ATP-binding protein [Cellulomonas fimi]AEE45117.1 integral membrane sensor signal transduction histidine kinase [Cellulomonas fimi ATCC 484]NNH06320.1 HAMP domain-containing protein [Cellulomonas fimi]VEH28289.1 Probable sensor histidine kinase TcrY [Cellulomonas fimi]